MKMTSLIVSFVFVTLIESIKKFSKKNNWYSKDF